MDDSKTVLKLSRPRFVSLPEAFTEISNSFEKLEHSSFSSNLAKGLPRRRRHSIHAPTTSSFTNAPEDVQNVFSRPLVVSYRPRQSEARRAFEIKTREAELPGVSRRSLDPPVFKEKIRERKSSCPLMTRSLSDGRRPAPVDPDSVALPKISGKHQAIGRRHSLPAPTEMVSLSCRESEGENTFAPKPLPQISQPENHKFTKDIGSVDGIKLCAVGTKVPHKHDRSQALQKHLEKAEARYHNDLEIKATRLFEWLKDQTDKKETD